MTPNAGNGVNTCNFIALLKEKKEIDETLYRWEMEYTSNGHEKLIQFANDKNTPRAEPYAWIRENKLSQKDAGILWEVLRDDDELTKKLLPLIPPESTYNNYKTLQLFGSALGGVKDDIRKVTGRLGLSAMGGVAAGVGVGGHQTATSVNDSMDNHEALKLAREAVHHAISKKRFENFFTKKSKC